MPQTIAMLYRFAETKNLADPIIHDR